MISSMGEKIVWRVEEVKGEKGELEKIDKDFVYFKNQYGKKRIIPVHCVIGIKQIEEKEEGEVKGK